MAVAPPTALVHDGFTTQELGMNDGISQGRLGPTQAALLINATTRGDYVTQRPGWPRIGTVLQEPPGRFQHASGYRTDAGRQFIIVVCGGRFFRVDVNTAQAIDITIPGDPNPSTLERGWSVQGEMFWIYNDGQTTPFIFSGGNARRATKKEIQPGQVITYVQGRLWYSLPDGLSFRATDLVRNPDSGTLAFQGRDSILRETENDFLNEGGDFAVPTSAGSIVAMTAAALLDTSQGQGPLQVLCERNGFTVNTPVDRDVWKNVTYPIQTESIIGAGASGAQNCILVNGDIFFRSPDGIRSWIVARRRFRDWGNTPQSFEVSNILKFDQPDLLTFGSGGVFDNRLLITTSPAWSNQGVYHRGLIALDLSPINSIQIQAPPVYDGLWTGLNILSMVPTVEGLFALTLADDNSIELWKISASETFDDGDGRIEWSHVPRQMFVEVDPAGRPGRTLKRLETADLEYDKLDDTTDFKMSWAPDGYPCYTEWAKWKECITQCTTEPTCTPPLTFQTGYQPRKRLPEPPDACVPGSKRPLANFYSLNPLITITGPARLLSVRFAASLQTEPKFEANTCEDDPCVAVQCCGLDYFTYRSKSPLNPPYYGSGGSGGNGGSGGSGGSGGGGGDTMPALPTYPFPGAPCESYNIFLGAVITDQFSGITHPVGVLPPFGITPPEYLLPGVLEAWSAEVWKQYLAAKALGGWTASVEMLVWWEIHNTGLEWMANQVFPGLEGGYNGVVDLDWKITVLFCNP